MDGFRAASAFVEVSAKLDDRQVLAAAERAVREIDSKLTTGVKRTGETVSDTLGDAGESGGRKMAEGVTNRLRDERGRFVGAGKKIGDDSGDSATKSFAQIFGAKLPGLIGSTPGMPAAAAVLGTALAPTVAATLAAAVVGGAGIGGVIGGAVIASRDPRVKAAGSDLGKFMLTDLETRAAGFVPVMITGIGKIKAGWSAVGMDLDRIFASSRFVDPLVDGAVAGGKKLIHGISIAVENADPIIDAFGRQFDAIGDSAGNFFETLSGDAKEGASAVDDLTNAVTNFMDATTRIVHYGAQIKGATDDLDVWIDRQRHGTEQTSLLAHAFSLFGGQLDLTADGFKANSKEADAAYRASQGLATVTDFATLKIAGMSDAQIAATDASGTYRQKITEVNREAGITQTRFYEGNAAMVIFNASMAEGIEKTGSLSAAFMAVNGHALNARQAESNYQAAIDNVSASIKENGRTLDLHTAKGRANDKAIRDLVGTVNANAQAAYDAKAATGDLAGAETDAKKVYESGRQQLIKNLTQILGNKDAAIALAGKIMAIPKKWDTDVDVKDKATPKVNAIKHEISTIHGRTVTIAVKYETHGSAPGEHIIGQGTQRKDRWGGVHTPIAMAAGGTIGADIYPASDPPLIQFAERETGGEAYIPKNGNRARNMSILSTAAGWNDATVVPNGARGRGGPVYQFAAGSIVLDASKIRSIGDLLRMLDSLKQTARAMGVKA